MIAPSARPIAESATNLDAQPLQPLFDATQDGPTGDRLRGIGMPAELERRYGGRLLVPLRADRPTLVANFVTTLDGVVALGPGGLSGGGAISGFHEPDRFVMGLLRAIADVVLVGAGTVRGSRNKRWTPGQAHPQSAEPFAQWRERMGLAPQPTTLIVTGSGAFPGDHPGLNDAEVPIVIGTTPAGAARLGDGGLPKHVRVEPLGDGDGVTGDQIIALGASLGARLILSEGGPHAFGELIAADLLDELFLTLAPQVIGRDGPGRLGLVEGVELPAAARWQDLVSVRRSGHHLFLRYRRRERLPAAEEF